MITIERNDKKNKGFTLGEVVTTVTIIGILSAVAIPNYLRIKMNVNMEMVKQHLKTIGTHMNDLYNQNKTFPENINTLGNSDEELAITASLNAIDQKDYTRDGYLTYTNRSTYTFRTCPKEGRWGIAGDRCFLLDPMGIREINEWDAAGVAMFSHFTDGSTVNDVFAANPPLSSARQIELLSALFELRAYAASLRSSNDPNLANSPILPAATFGASPGIEAKIANFFPQIYDNLRSKGIELYVNQQYSQNLAKYGLDPTKFATYFDAGFKFKDPINSSYEYQTRSQEAGKTYTVFERTGQ